MYLGFHKKFEKQFVLVALTPPRDSAQDPKTNGERTVLGLTGMSLV